MEYQDSKLKLTKNARCFNTQWATTTRWSKASDAPIQKSEATASQKLHTSAQNRQKIPENEP